MPTLSKKTAKSNSKSPKQTTPAKPSRPAAPQPTKGKPVAPLTPEQKIRRLEDANTQLRKELAAADKRHSDLTDKFSGKLEGLEKAVSGKILTATKEFSADKFLKAVHSDYTASMYCLFLDLEQLHKERIPDVKAAFDSLRECYPELRELSEAMEHQFKFMEVRLRDVYGEMLRCGIAAREIVEVFRL